MGRKEKGWDEAAHEQEAEAKNYHYLLIHNGRGKRRLIAQ